MSCDASAAAVATFAVNAVLDAEDAVVLPRPVHPLDGCDEDGQPGSSRSTSDSSAHTSNAATPLPAARRGQRDARGTKGGRWRRQTMFTWQVVERMNRAQPRQQFTLRSRNDLWWSGSESEPTVAAAYKINSNREYKSNLNGGSVRTQATLDQCHRDNLRRRQLIDACMADLDRILFFHSSGDNALYTIHA